mmetsp:Transcript_12424/g.18635  ORF Transcript_12424/g.18635 Transcript_12424/m.18635 type:complete len:228 (+) Transcript_12424:434-1117(+)
MRTHFPGPTRNDTASTGFFGTTIFNSAGVSRDVNVPGTMRPGVSYIFLPFPKSTLINFKVVPGRGLVVTCPFIALALPALFFRLAFSLSSSNAECSSLLSRVLFPALAAPTMYTSQSRSSASSRTFLSNCDIPNPVLQLTSRTAPPIFARLFIPMYSSSLRTQFSARNCPIFEGSKSALFAARTTGLLPAIESSSGNTDPLKSNKSTSAMITASFSRMGRNSSRNVS